MSFTPTKEQLQEAKEYIDKFTDNYGVALRVKMLIEQAEKAQRYEKALKEIAESKEDTSCNEIALKYEVIAENALNG